MAEDTISKLAKNLYASRTQITEPADRYYFEPCGPDLVKTDSSAVSVLFPKTADSARKTVPLMGGSVVKISYAKVNSEDERYSAYYKNINGEIKSLFGSKDLEIITKKSTSALRIYANKLLIENVSSDQNIGIIPTIYLSTTSTNPDELDARKDYFGVIRKNAIFSFFPIESIREYLNLISVKEERTTSIGEWSGISGKTYKELYDISKKDSLTEEEIVSLILDVIPFFNLSETEILSDPITPALGGYFTIIGDSIYLKMPDISGIDSAGYGQDIVSNSALNFLFQLLSSDLEQKLYSIRNISIKTTSPIYSNLITTTVDEYDLRTPEEFLITFSSSKKPTAIYLSPAINEEIKIKNDLFRSIRASQSGSFIEYSSYPNPFISILDEKILIKEDTITGQKFTSTDKIDEVFKKVYFKNFKIIKESINKKYNKNLSENGPIWNYLEKILDDDLALVLNNPLTSYSTGFPFVQEFFEKSFGVIGQSLSTYEFVGTLSRENLILHNGKAYDDNEPEASGKRGNNSKYFKKNFIANTSGLSQNYRPRVFSTPDSFIPSTWIKSSNINPEKEEDIYSVKISTSDILKFYTKNATEMKFVLYAYDGENQVCKIENGYLDIKLKAPEILTIAPDGTAKDGTIISCGDTKITIQTNQAKTIDLIKIGGLEIKKDSSWEITPNSISIVVPCDSSVVEGETKVFVATSGVYSSSFNVYVANAVNTVIPTENVAGLPTKINNLGPFEEEDVNSDNLKISGQNYEIPISYLDPRSLIKIKSKKGIFKEGRDVFLYLGFESEDIAKNFSQNIVSYSSKAHGNIFIAKDFNYQLDNNPLGDFYRKGKNKAYLYFPGAGNFYKPLDLLTTLLSKAFFVISTKNESNFSAQDSLGVIRLGTDTKRPFSPPPTVIGLAANYSDKTSKNHFFNFSTDFKEVAKIIFNKEGFEEKSDKLNQLIDSKDRFKKLLLLFSYRDIEKFRKKNFSLYINNEKVDRLFSFDGVKRASKLDEIDPEKNQNLFNASKYLYYFVIKNLELTLTENAIVSIDIYDPDFSISTSSQDKYKDYSVKIPKENISIATDETSTIFINSEDIVIPIVSNSNSGKLLGNYELDRALTGFFTNKYESNVYYFEDFPGVQVTSNLTGKISNLNGTEEKLLLYKDTISSIVSVLPNSYFSVSSGAEVFSNEYLASETDYLVFLRLKVSDICKIAIPKPNILKVPENLVVVPGEILTFVVENILSNFVMELAGVEAKIVDVNEIESNVYEVKVIVPEGVSSVISLNDCGWKLYNGDQVLGSGDNQLGRDLANNLERAASNLLSDIGPQFDKHKKTLENHPLKFISVTIDTVNQAKELITSFCNYSFKITADLSINLQGFSQLLVPVKVIFCIIDVICNIFNPFQLPLAIIRLFECLYDLILLLPQISIPVMLFNLLIHLLDFLECLIVKIINLVIAINLVIDAIVIAVSGKINFKEILMLEEILLKYVISLEADLELMGPIVQVLSIFLQLLAISFRFPCSINPNSTAAPCGIDGFELSSMVSGLISEPSGTAPDIVYNMDKKYLIPVAKPYVELASGTYDPPSYESAIEPVRGGLAFDGTSAVDGNLFDISFFNPESMRKKENSFSSETDITSDTVITLRSSYTKRKKHLSSQQGVIFKFNERTWKSILPAFDRQIIDEYQSFDTPIVLLEKDGENLNIANSSSYGNFYSMIDGKSMMTEVSSSGTASVKPLTLDIIQNGVTAERTFETIPSMLIMDEESNVYVISKDGIVFGTYKTTSGDTVVGIKEIKATIISQKSSVGESFSKEEESIEDPDDPTKQIINNIFSLPQIYFVDTRVAAEAIQSKCETASINQLPLDLTGDGGATEAEKMLVCINDFLDSVRLQTGTIKNSLSLGKVPEKMSEEKITTAYVKLIDCTNDSINNICSIVVNPLNTSFKLVGDSDQTPILPDPSSSFETTSDAEVTGPALTGAREYAGGVGDSITIPVDTNAIIQLIPRDSYDNLITYDLSAKAKLQITSDTTGEARINLVPIDSNPQNYWSYDNGSRSYLASVFSAEPGIVKVKAIICNQPVQALTYSDLINDSTEGDNINCVDGVTESLSENNNIPLGALTRIDRILTINFVSSETEVITQSSTDQSSIITEPQLFATNMEN